MNKILIVDEDQDSTKLLKCILSRENHNTLSTTPLAQKPNRIFFSHLMPGVESARVYRNLRAERRLGIHPLVSN